MLKQEDLRHVQPVVRPERLVRNKEEREERRWNRKIQRLRKYVFIFISVV